MLKPRLTSSTARRAAGSGLILAAVGIPIQIAGGVDYPTVPPGLLILTAAALLMLFAPWRWAVVVAALATLFISVGAVVTPNFRHQLGDPGAVVTFVGSAVQVIGLVLALAGGAGALREALRPAIAR